MGRRIFDEEEEDERSVTERADRELTLGMGTLLLLFFALVLLCGLCFGIGFSLGEHSAAKTAPLAAAGSSGMQPISHGNEKPSAAPSESVKTQPVAASMTDDLSTADGSGLATQSVTEQPSTVQASTGHAATEQAERLVSGAAGQSVQAALPQAKVAEQEPAPMGTPRPALPEAGSSGSYMVQVAAVSDPVDAQVLLDALRKRGYAVTLVHAATDRLMHVQVGPFLTRADALATRQKLLNDGYNAIVK